ncbi:6019_t:CDS:2 [Gigaspora rosea]|nr:6019_t:CDS:2 [Gigaspora rosea]
MVPNFRFQPRLSDLCEVCTSFKAKLLVAKQDVDEYNKVQFRSQKSLASKKSGGEEISFQLLHSNNFDKNGQLNTIPSVPLSSDQKKYLYTKIRQHVDDPYKDILCLQP